VLDVNTAACRLHGLTREQLLGRNMVDLVAPEDRERVMREYSQWFSGTQQLVEGHALTSDGRVIPVEVREA